MTGKKYYKFQCVDCGTHPCYLEMPTNDNPEVCILVGDEEREDLAHLCNWKEIVPRRGRKTQRTEKT